MIDLEFVHPKNPINRINDQLKGKLVAAQQESFDRVFSTAASLFSRATTDLRLSVTAPSNMESRSAIELSDQPLAELVKEVSAVLVAAGIVESAIPLQAIALSHRIQLVRAFHDPDAVLAKLVQKIAGITSSFPKSATDIERGRNPGDVLDPYILAATQTLLYQGDFQGAIEATVAHKALMIIEGLMGHLHEEVIGEMRGNIKVPEPRGVNQEIIDLDFNPFPGADLVQPPLVAGAPLRFHQVKSKTGSAKGGDGKRLGAQLKILLQYYGGEIYYDALIGNTLRGHRSMNGVLAEAPQAIVLVGAAAFSQLTGSKIGPELLLRVYQNAFLEVARRTGYHIDAMSALIFETFKTRAEQAGEGFLEVILEDSTGGQSDQQDSRSYIRARSIR